MEGDNAESFSEKCFHPMQCPGCSTEYITDTGTAFAVLKQGTPSACQLPRRVSSLRNGRGDSGNKPVARDLPPPPCPHHHGTQHDRPGITRAVRQTLAASCLQHLPRQQPLGQKCRTHTWAASGQAPRIVYTDSVLSPRGLKHIYISDFHGMQPAILLLRPPV